MCRFLWKLLDKSEFLCYNDTMINNKSTIQGVMKKRASRSGSIGNDK